MDSLSPSVDQLRGFLLQQIFTAFGRPIPGWMRLLLTPGFWPIAQKFARLTARLDQQVASGGINAGARWFLPHFVKDIRTLGTENIPPSGPLLVAGNHPGAYDVVAITASLNRDDLKIVASDESFYRSLPHIHPHFIYVTHDPHNRMGAIRNMIHHLEGGGALLLFPSGIVDPDPAILPGAHQALQAWSGSLEIVMRKVLDTRLVIAISSGVLSATILKNPVSRLPRLAWQQRKLAEFLQVMLQLTFGLKFGLVPRLSFSQPFKFDPVQAREAVAARQKAILFHAEEALTYHLEVFAHA